MEEGVIYHDESKNRFFLTIDGKESMVDYQKDENLMDLYFTYVPDEFRGQGIASKLVQKALDYAHHHNYRVKPSCPFIESFIQNHKEYQSILV